jgi:hypothetical protein
VLVVPRDVDDEAARRRDRERRNARHEGSMIEDEDEVLQRDLRYVIQVSMGGNIDEARRAALHRIAQSYSIIEQNKARIAVPLSNFMRKP